MDLSPSPRESPLAKGNLSTDSKNDHLQSTEKTDSVCVTATQKQCTVVVIFLHCTVIIITIKVKEKHRSKPLASARRGLERAEIKSLLAKSEQE